MPRPGVKPIFEPASVALYGASPTEGTIGHVLLRNLQQAGFKGRIYRINPKYKRIGSHKCYPSLRQAKKTVDLAIIATPAQTVPNIISECGELEVPAAIVISAGFREAGEQSSAHATGVSVFSAPIVSGSSGRASGSTPRSATAMPTRVGSR